MYSDIRILKHKKDPILEQYEAEEYADFEILGDETDQTSNPIYVQQFIDYYLTYVIKRLEIYKEGDQLTEEEKIEVEEIIVDAKGLKSNQTRFKKVDVRRGFSVITAKTRKLGLEIWGELKKELFKEGIKQITKKIFESPDDIMNMLKGLLE